MASTNWLRILQECRFGKAPAGSDGRVKPVRCCDLVLANMLDTTITAAILYIYGSAIIPTTQYGFYTIHEITYLSAPTSFSCCARCNFGSGGKTERLGWWWYSHRLDLGFLLALQCIQDLRNSRNVVEVILPPKSARKGAQAGLKPDWKCLCHKHHSP